MSSMRIESKNNHSPSPAPFGSHTPRVAPNVASWSAGILLSALGSLVQGAPTPSSSTSLDEVIVTATRSAVSLTDVPASASVVTSTQIQDTPAQELDDVLRLVPGIDLLGYSGTAQHPTSDSLGMRGLGGGAQGLSRALVMLDGVPLNDAFFGYIQWGRVPLDNVERVEVVRGGGSPLWGNYAEGGVINIITKEPTRQEAVLNAEGGSYGTYLASAYGSYFPSNSTKLQAFASTNGSSGFQQVPEYERAPFNVPTTFRAQNVHLKGTLEPSDDLIAHLAVDYHDNHQRLETVLDTNTQKIYTFTGDVTKSFAESGSLTATGFYSYSSFGTNNSTYFPNQTDLASTTQALNEIHDVRAHDAGASLIWRQDLSGPLVSYMVGADLRRISGADTTNHFFAPDFSPESTTTDTRAQQVFIGGFAQATLKPTTDLQIIASGRVQSFRNSDGYDGSLGGAGAVRDQSHASFSPRLDARYAFGNGFSLRGAYYQSFRAPNIGDQFYTFAAGGFALLPAPTLEPEKLKGGEIGIDYVASAFRSQFTLYRTSIDNYILAEPTTNPVFTPAGWYVVQNANIASVQAQGFESEVTWEAGAGISMRLSYTYADSIVKSNPLDPGSIGKQIVDVPKNKVAGSIAYRNRGGWQVSTQAYWVDRTAWASPDHTDPGYPGAISADPHFLVDATGSYTFNGGVELYLKLQNLLNRRYIATSYSAPSAQIWGAPFQAFAGVRVKLR
jgi:outer membrane receptor protein involved in Fe transport